MSASVAINLLWLVPGTVGGSEQSTLATVRALADLAPADLDIRLMGLAPLLAAHPDLAEAFPVEVLSLSGRSRPARVAAEVTWLARRTRGVDLVHHAGGTAPPRRTAPYVLTLHDLQPLERSATHSSIKRAYLASTIPPSVRRARAVAVPSEFVRRAVIDRFDVAPERVVAIPHGVDLRAAPATPADELRRAHGLSDGPVVLYPAITYPHKNHQKLVEAFALVLADHPDAQLVLPGGQGGSEAEVAAAVQRLGLGASVRRLGRVSDADIAGLYAMATVVAVPSRYEGFGLPAVEAMGAGAALVAADATALPEVVGDGGLLVDPDDVDGWARAISGLLADPDARQRLAASGRRRAERYSWEANAGGFAGLYRGALTGR
ncbi:MAG: glycosyltransferase family 4 protein [Acidimicrobiales bacterium]